MQKSATYDAIMLCVSTLVLILVSIFLIASFTKKNNERIIKQNTYYLKDNATISKRTLSTLFSTGIHDISTISNIYEKAIDKKEFDYKELDIFSHKSTFDYIRFITLDGKNIREDGNSIDCKDRDYFIRGSLGDSGVTYVEKSRWTGGKALLFYTPFYHNTVIKGVLLGVYNEAHLQKLMTSNFFGLEASEYLCKKDGSIIGSGSNKKYDNIFDFIKEEMSLKKSEYAVIKETIAHGWTYSFTYKNTRTKKTAGNVYITSIDNGHYIMLKTFPQAANDLLAQNINDDTVDLELKLFALFIIYITFIATYYIAQSHTLKGKSYKFEKAINTVNLLYSRFVMLDLQKKLYTYMQQDTLQKLGIPQKGNYDDLLAQYPEMHYVEEDARKFRMDMSLQTLRTNLNLNSRILRYMYKVNSKPSKWEKVSVIKLNMDKDETTQILAAIEDVTSLKLEEDKKRQALETAIQTAQAANNAKSEFLSRMSHDIRTPMNAILGLTAVAMARFNDKTKVADCLDKISASGRHLLSLINEVLDMSRIESGKMQLSNVDFDMEELLEDVQNITQVAAKEKGLNFSMTTVNLTHKALTGDSLRIRQVFVNIISNSINYTQQGGDVTITVCEKDSQQKDIALFEIIFEDTGIGMDSTFIDKLYKPFERENNAISSSVHGFGLGMAIVKTIVTAMDGTIDVESHINAGTKFTLSLPIKVQHNAHTIKPTQKVGDIIEAVKTKNFSHCRALLVEDNDLNRDIAVEILGMTGIKIDTAVNGAEAIKAFKDSECFYYDIIFMDIQMPIASGYEATEAIRAMEREDAKTIPIIAMTANAFNEDVQKALSCGMNEHIAKPLDFARLVMIMTKLLPPHI